MNIRTKTLLITSVTLIILAIIVSTVGVLLMLQGFERIERDLMQDNALRVTESINAERENMNVKLGDWAMWDDTYEFVIDKNQAYIESNLTDNALETLVIDTIVFVGAQGEVIYEKTIMPEDLVSASTSSTLREHLASGSALLHHEAIDSFQAGIVSLAEGPMLVVSRPIVTSMNEGPIHGTMLFGKYINSRELKRLQTITRLPIELFTINSANLPEDVGAAVIKAQGRSEDYLIKTVGGSEITSYTILPDIFGNPMFIARVRLPRDIYHQALNTAYRLALFSTIGIVAILLLLGFVLEKNVFSRITKLTHSVSVIEKSGDLAARLPEERRSDEIATLSQDINKMLQSLEHAQHSLSEEKGKSQQYIDVVRLMVVVINRDQTIRLVNKYMCEVLGYSEQELVGKNWFDLLIPQEDRETIREVFRKNLEGHVSQVEYHENYVMVKDGRKLMVAWHNAELKDQDGKTYATLSAGEDITQKSEAEKLLRDNEERYRIAAQQTGQLIYDYDISSGRISWAGAIEEVTGYTYEEFRSIDVKGWEEHIHADDRARALEELEKRKQSQGTYHMEYQFRKKDGSYCLIEDRGIYLPNRQGEITRMIGAMADITKRKEEEAALLSRTIELEKTNTSMVGRELKMVELKKEIEALKHKLSGNG